jgi:replicative DNA helicase
VTSTRQPARATRTGAPAVALNRVLPNAEAAEQALLGALLLAPAEAAPIVLERIREEHFYFARHQVLFREMVGLYDALRALDMVTLTQRLQDKGVLQEIGGAGYLADLAGNLPTLANIEDHIGLVLEKHLLRQCIGIGSELIDGAFEDQEDVAAFLDGISQKLFALTAARRERGMVPAAESVAPALEQIGAELENQGITGLSTGLVDLDRKLGGLKPRTFTVIAARPGAGKTTLAMNIAEHVACELGIPVGVFTIEMGNDELVKRLLCSRARFNIATVRAAQDQAPALNRLTRVAGEIKGAPIWLDDTAPVSIQQIRARARRLAQTAQIGLLVVDYLQLVKSAARRIESKRVDELTEISAGLNALKKELSIPILVCAQLNRQSEFRAEGTPKLSDLRECGAIEQDADVAILLHRPELHADSEDERRSLAGRAAAIVAKHRGGPTGEVPLHFIGAENRFVNASRSQA